MSDQQVNEYNSEFIRTLVCTNILKDGYTCNNIVIRYNTFGSDSDFEVCCPKCSKKYHIRSRPIRELPKGPIKSNKNGFTIDFSKGGEN